jgi:hypothetical protein
MGQTVARYEAGWRRVRDCIEALLCYDGGLGDTSLGLWTLAVPPWGGGWIWGLRRYTPSKVEYAACSVLHTRL